MSSCNNLSGETETERGKCKTSCKPCFPKVCPPQPHKCCSPGQFLSSYSEVLGDGQTIASGANIIFDRGSEDSIGNNITLSNDGTVFTINRTGLYQVNWDINLSSATAPTATVVVGIIENGESASGAASSGVGNFSSGTVIEVSSTPFTLTLHNYGSEITIVRPSIWQDSAASIRIIRFADGPSK